MRIKPLPSLQELRTRFTGDFLKGELIHTHRWGGTRAHNIWNSLYAGKPAGWYRPDGRRRVTIDEERFYSSHLLWKLVTGEDPPEQIDHVDGNPGNEVFENLRPASNRQNNRNKKISASNTTGYKGVTQNPDGKFVAQITLNYENHYLGRFHTAEEAHAAYCKKAEELHGEFANLGGLAQRHRVENESVEGLCAG